MLLDSLPRPNVRDQARSTAKRLRSEHIGVRLCCQRSRGEDRLRRDRLRNLNLAGNGGGKVYNLERRKDGIFARQDERDAGPNTSLEGMMHMIDYKLGNTPKPICGLACSFSEFTCRNPSGDP
jgi:hypothetical protein